MPKKIKKSFANKPKDENVGEAPDVDSTKAEERSKILRKEKQLQKAARLASENKTDRTRTAERIKLINDLIVKQKKLSQKMARHAESLRKS